MIGLLVTLLEMLWTVFKIWLGVELLIFIGIPPLVLVAVGLAYMGWLTFERWRLRKP